MLTADEARELLSYEPDTGLLRWKVRSANRVNVGDIAGSIWRSGPKSYWIITVRRIRYYSHRLIWLIVTGCLPEYEIDHEDGNGLNNRWDNLRVVTHIENSKNKRRRSDNTSGHSGVSWASNRNMWLAYISSQKKFIRLGYFKNIEDAISARKSAEEKYGYHKNNGSDRPL